MGYTATGKIHCIGETIRVSERFTKREIVIEIADNPKYPQLVQFEAAKDRCQLLDGLRPGDTVTIDFNLRGREWSRGGESRFFNTLDVWRVELARDKPRGAEPRTERSGPPRTHGDTDDDLPF